MHAARLAAFERRLTRERAFWLETLAGEPQAAGLPLDFARPAEYNPAKATAVVPLDASVASLAAARVRQEPALALALTVAAIGACLHRLTGSNDVVLGTPVPADSPAALFNDIVALRVAIAENDTARGVLDAARTTLAGAFRNAAYPYARLIDLLALPRSAARTPLISIAVAAEGLNAEAGSPEAPVDIFVTARLHDGRLAATLQYDPRLFDASTMRQFAAQLGATIGWLTSNPEAPLSGLALMSAAERRFALETFNATEGAVPSDTMHRLFEAQAARTPEATAVVCGADAVTYRELDERANRLAHVLRASGVEPGYMVGVLLPHSIDTGVAVLGILKAGATFVPLDVDHPPARTQSALDDAGASLVVTEAFLSRVTADLAAAPVTRPDVEVAQDALAYAIYTSGSTGRPKGVAVPHSALVNYIWWARSVYLDAAPRDMALHSSLAFDLTVTSLFAPLTTGGAVVAYPAHEGEPPILDVLRDDRVDLIKLTPSHLALVAEQPTLPSRLRAFIVGGENLDAALARRIHERFGGAVALFNEYGPTEATVGCMIHRYDPGADHRRAVPIGAPAANTRIYLLDAHLEPVPTNGVGELYIGGAGLAAGYIGQAALTAERFVADPFHSGQRMYVTGDSARRLPDGAIEFIGRRDDQVKIRGHRIDLSEVRHAVMQQAQVRDCTVQRLLDEDGSPVLVAYYVSRQPIETAELRASARDRLVDAAVPGAFVFLRRLPLTLNGKVNLRALPDLQTIRRLAERSDEPPRTPSEMALADIWRALLKIDRVGVHDNFFELGGHSLIATQVVSRVRDGLGVELPLRSIFEHPTIAGLADRIDGTGMDAADTGQAGRIAKTPRSGPLPLSFAQQRLWFLDQLEPGSATYNIAARLRIDGPLDTDALRASLNRIVARHEALRTTFSDDEGAPSQQVADRLELPLPVLDFSDDDATRPFDLRTGPLIRARLLRLGADRHLLLLTLHHIVADGWSMNVLAREVSAFYAAEVEHREPALPPLPIQYADFSAWQRRLLTGQRLALEVAFWRESLAGVPVMELPTDRPRPAVQTFRGATLPVRLAPGLSDAVRRVSVELGTTPFVTLLACYAAALQRWTGQRDLAIGSPIANRTRPELEGLIGFFANTLVLRVGLDGHPTLRELVARVQATVLAASAHQELPFERLVDELQPDRLLSHNPLFQVMFGVHPAAVTDLTIAGLRFETQPADTGTAKFDLNLQLADDGEQLEGFLEYNTDLFERTTVERWRAQFETLAAAALSNLDRPVRDLQVLPPGERRQILEGFNATVAPAPDRCMHELVEDTVAQYPDQIAAVFPGVAGAPDQTITYRDLNRRANHLAHYLRRHGAGPDVPVGLCLERSLDMAVAVFAVLKAGAAYVPLDPAYPRERLAAMLDAARPPIVVTHAPTRGLTTDGSTQTVDLDAERAAIEREPDTNIASGVTPDHLLYVIYTSGSTGRPKGIALSHRALVNLIQWNLDTFAEGRGVLQFASLSFDASFHEIFAAWASGRHVVMIPEEWRRDPTELLPYLGRWPVETAILPVVVLHQWAEAQRGQTQLPPALAALRHIVTTGEQLVITQPIVELFTRLTACTLHNHYGPSETHVVTALTLDPRPGTWPARPSIGRPIANSSIFVLDDLLNPVPIGVTGELYIGGLGLARGYLNRPDLTAAAFLPHPASEQPGERMYATGDLARWLADGTVEFLGRRDDQVKIRGFRVELGDVESTINRQPDVSQSVAVLRDGAGGPRLVAYVVPAHGRMPTIEALRAFAHEHLPDYMVPAQFVVLEHVALTANGKIDRRALPAPGDVPVGRIETPPVGPAEELIAAIWCELLGLTQVGARDNFFHVGGHSLLATQLASRIRRTFDMPLPLKAIFEAPTVAGLVDVLARDAGGRELIDEIASAIRAVDALSADEVRALLAEAPGGRSN